MSPTDMNVDENLSCLFLGYDPTNFDKQVDGGCSLVIHLIAYANFKTYNFDEFLYQVGFI